MKQKCLLLCAFFLVLNLVSCAGGDVAPSSPPATSSLSPASSSLSTASGYSSATMAEELYPAIIGPTDTSNEMGYINRAGEVMLRGYMLVRPFSEGLAAVADFGDPVHAPQWYLINAKGEEQFVGERFDTIGAGVENSHYIGAFSGGAAMVSQNEKNYILTTSRIKRELPASLDGCYYRFSEGLVAFRDKETELYGFFDTEGHIAVQPNYRLVSLFSEGLAAVAAPYDSGPLGQLVYINSKGEYVIETGTTYSWSMANEYTFKDGIAYIEEGRYINPQGEILLDISGLNIADAKNFSEGLAAFCISNEDNDWLWGFVDLEGNVVIEPQFSEIITGFRNGLAAVTDEYHKMGYVDMQGNMVIDFICTNIWSSIREYTPKNLFENGIESFYFSNSSNWQFGYFDKTGKIIYCVDLYRLLY